VFLPAVRQALVPSETGAAARVPGLQFAVLGPGGDAAGGQLPAAQAKITNTNDKHCPGSPRGGPGLLVCWGGRLGAWGGGGLAVGGVAHAGALGVGVVGRGGEVLEGGKGGCVVVAEFVVADGDGDG